MKIKLIVIALLVTVTLAFCAPAAIVVPTETAIAESKGKTAHRLSVANG
jgi:hypothetical protein